MVLVRTRLRTQPSIRKRLHRTDLGAPPDLCFGSQRRGRLHPPRLLLQGGALLLLFSRLPSSTWARSAPAEGSVCLLFQPARPSSIHGHASLEHWKKRSIGNPSTPSS